MSRDGAGPSRVRRARPVAQARVAPGPLHDLKALLYRLYVEAGAPTLEEIARLAREDQRLPGAPSRDGVLRVLSKPEVPANQADAVAVAVVLARLARWDAADAARRVRDHWVAARLHPAEALRTVAQWDPVRLGVHPAIEADDTTPHRDAGAMTSYVEREHDQVLRERLAQAVGGRAVFAVLVGGSCTGKTRALYEAVAAVLPRWPLLVPGHAAQLVEWVAQDAVDADTVLWLNETQRFLPEAGAVLAELLQRVRPLAVVGSMWPQYWNALVAPPHPGGPAASVDLRAQTRTLLEAHGPRIAVPERFDATDTQVLDVLARDDGRLRAAALAGAGDGRVIQHLTGGPELVELFEDESGEFFTPLERAVISAALDARRLGHASPIPPTLLAEAAAGYLSDRGLVSDDPQWAETALRAICRDPRKHVNGAITALTEQRVAPGVGPADGYSPADYLDQHARRTRERKCAPTAFWDAAERHARTTRDLGDLGDSARRCTRHDVYAERLYLRSIAAGDAQGLLHLAVMRESADEVEEAERLYRQAVDAGESFGLEQLARLRIIVGDWAAGEVLARQAAAAGHTTALRLLAVLWDGSGSDPDKAEGLAREALGAGDVGGLVDLVSSRARAGDWERAERMAREAAGAGNPYGLVNLAMSHERAGDLEAAARLYRLAADAGYRGSQGPGSE
ncbi:hypothetical protein ABT186_09095 [Streptomyces sp. NPDC001634]|uniref:tetratricopeptide repeat protein n=1 Tax=Streptomyces sp. NPDC001634 TaxID=3154390 RepID=UPI003320A1B4